MAAVDRVVPRHNLSVGFSKGDVDRRGAAIVRGAADTMVPGECSYDSFLLDLFVSENE
jgi:hypothetical protein